MAALVISIIAIIIAGASAWHSRQSAAINASRRAEELQAAKAARMNIALLAHPRAQTNYVLIRIFNAGPASARDIRLTQVETVPEGPAFFIEADPERFPINELLADEAQEVPAYAGDGFGLVHFDLSWIDGRGFQSMRRSLAVQHTYSPKGG